MKGKVLQTPVSALPLKGVTQRRLGKETTAGELLWAIRLKTTIFAIRLLKHTLI
ncbi:hypothetical protein MKQ68_20940 [Chitinophaga horti]|uniref:Uncharacterized protein n=1 Tax=Chitinophaga horti TaxID=2920382 RepID=A0ABY6IYS8_9BACT|nr:hypothetical protein [Chitinophaga horti]UYQ92554.1 hypothetical protein MKQ68_20940 [Chitinophaga horti]